MEILRAIDALEATIEQTPAETEAERPRAIERLLVAAESLRWAAGIESQVDTMIAGVVALQTDYEGN